MKERLKPFLVLLEAKYAPLLFAVAPQSFGYSDLVVESGSFG